MPHQTFPKPCRVDEKRERKTEAEAIWRAVCKAVDARDGRICRCCDKRSDPEATGLLERGHRHHIIYRSAGGADSTSNICTLCANCHSAEHHHRLRIEGDPDVALTFFRTDERGAWFTCREEIAVRQVRRD